MTDALRSALSAYPRRRTPRAGSDAGTAEGGSGFLRREGMRPAYRTGSSSEALEAARRDQLNRGLGLVLGVFLLYGLLFCLVPGVLSVEVFGGLRINELVALAQVSVVAAGVLSHDRHARRHVEPLASRIATREPAPDAAGFDHPGGAARSAAVHRTAHGRRPETASADAGGFNAFDSSRAFGGPRHRRTAEAAT